MKTKIYQQIALLTLIVSILAACNSEQQQSNSGGTASEFSRFFNFSSKVDVDELSNAMQKELLDSAGIYQYLEKEEVPPKLQKDFLTFYKEREYMPAWLDEDGMTGEAEDLIKAVQKSHEHGLDPENYRLQVLDSLRREVEADNAEMEDYQLFDKTYTLSYLKLASHLLAGGLEPEKLDAMWETSSRKKDLAPYLAEALEEEEIVESLERLEPSFATYEGLKHALAHYRELEKRNEKWIKLPGSLVLRPGDSTEYAAQLARKLYSLGDTEEQLETRGVYTPELAAAVASFQERHGIKEDGVVAENTLAMLNVPISERIDQIKLNLERLRWMPERPDGRYVVVNVPEYMLYVFEGADSTLQMRVIVGEAYNSTTPIFNDTMEYISFSPTWTVPMSIATEEMLPRLRKNPGYLGSRNFKLYESWQEDAPEVNPFKINWNKVEPDEFPYRIVQQPGPSNALGRVKFMFPNRLSIYLHDTPSDYLFDQAERDFSHGCIRVEKPVELATYLLQEKGFGREEVMEMMNLPEPENVTLPEEVPVFIEYRTAWMGQEGRVHFREDIYGHDRTQMGTFKEALASTEPKAGN
ncbi:L,D-transpeptidase family protein [Nafulsella turpanensis]|uniref:L,D-transpeptidase family protein n=1 Tax=Nafulsella turpanensis TaxID=1265690 RepID=UPI00034D6B9B|nr:L,D-transpeptidase family protein [Nafulsella turpanensis]